MKHKTFRALLSLVLVCVLLISWSPIRAQASALPEVAGVVTKVIPFAKVVEPAALGIGGTLFCWVAAGLGILFTAAQAVQAYNDFQDFTGELETSIYYFPDGSWSYGVDMTFVERVRAFLFDKGILVDKRATIGTYEVPPATALAEAQAAKHSRLVYEKRGTVISYHLVYSNESQIYVRPMYDNGTGIEIGTVESSATIYGYSASTGTWNTFKGQAVGGNSTHKIIDIYMIGASDAPEYVTTLDGADLGIVVSPEVPMPEAYPEWHTNSRPAANPDTQEEITVLPIPLNPSADPETQIGTLTQPDIWQGSISDPMPDTDPDTGTDTDPDTGTDVPPADIADYSVDLTNFFPFCLPFDIYVFFELLAADPEAPHLEFDIPFPFMDEPWHLVIDLSAWDNVALLARRLELLGFIIGLCVFTREKFLRS